MIWMTEKRFSYEEKYVTLDGGVFVIAQSKNDAELISKTLNQLLEENEQLKKKILEEIDLKVAYVNESYSDGRMSKEQHDGAIISLSQLREKFE